MHPSTSLFTSQGLAAGLPPLSMSPSGVLKEIHRCLRYDNCSVRTATGSSPVTRVTVPATIEPSVAILVIACNRPSYVSRTLDSLLKCVGVWPCEEGRERRKTVLSLIVFLPLPGTVPLQGCSPSSSVRTAHTSKQPVPLAPTGAELPTSR